MNRIYCEQIMINKYGEIELPRKGELTKVSCPHSIDRQSHDGKYFYKRCGDWCVKFSEPQVDEQHFLIRICDRIYYCKKEKFKDLR